MILLPACALIVSFLPNRIQLCPVVKADRLETALRPTLYYNFAVSGSGRAASVNSDKLHPAKHVAATQG